MSGMISILSVMMIKRYLIVTYALSKYEERRPTIRCLLLTSVSTCFGHHYAHLQENKGPVTAFGVLFWFCWMWLVAVVGRCVVRCEHCQGFCSNNNLHSVHILKRSAPQPLPTTTNRTRAIHQMR
jgi:glycerol-3-phosphate acyltransferase PlsY